MVKRAYRGRHTPSNAQLPGSLPGSYERKRGLSDQGRDFADPGCSGPDVRALLARTREPFWALRLTPTYHGPGGLYAVINWSLDRADDADIDDQED